MNTQPVPLRTGDLVVKVDEPKLKPRTITKVEWTPLGDIICLQGTERELGPFYADNYERVNHA